MPLSCAFDVSLLPPLRCFGVRGRAAAGDSDASKAGRVLSGGIQLEMDAALTEMNIAEDGLVVLLPEGKKGEEEENSTCWDDAMVSRIAHAISLGAAASKAPSTPPLVAVPQEETLFSESTFATLSQVLPH